MKKIFPALGAVLAFGSSLVAQDVVLAQPAAGSKPVAISGAAQFDATQLEQLLAPIALYPDALIALILPASTVSSDVVLAARFLRNGGDANAVDAQPWDDSVRALARYPDVLKWMDENLAWTKQLGEAFVAQPTEIMNAVQRLRLKARAVGNLSDTPQQQVVVDNSTISIVPAQPDVIYVPYYDPEIVYVSRPTYYTRPLFTFGPAYTTGFWLSYNLDWHRRKVWCVDRPYREKYWRDYRHSWHRPRWFSDVSRPDYCRPWTPRSSFTHSRSVYHGGRSRIVRPHYDRPNYDRRHSGGRGYDDNDRRHETRWDRNYDRSRHATGERFPQPPPRGPGFSRNSDTTPNLPLADALPQPLPSPLPDLNPPSATPDRQSGSGSYANRRADRYDFRRRHDGDGRGNHRRVDPIPRDHGPRDQAPRNPGVPDHGPRTSGRSHVNTHQTPSNAPTFSSRPATTPRTHPISARNTFQNRPTHSTRVTTPNAATLASGSYSRSAPAAPAARPAAPVDSPPQAVRSHQPRSGGAANLPSHRVGRHHRGIQP